MSTCDLEPLISLALEEMKKGSGALQSTCMNSGKTKWGAWLNWDLGSVGPDDLQVRTAQIMMCNHKKLKLCLKYRHIFKKGLHLRSTQRAEWMCV